MTEQNPPKMMHDEVIDVLKGLVFGTFDRTTAKEREALDTAIKALEQESVLDKIRAEIEGWYWQADKQALAKDACVVDAMIDLFIRTIDKYKAESGSKDGRYRVGN